MKLDNIFRLPESLDQEWFETLWQTPSFRLERIVSAGHSTPPGQWYDQDSDEWVVLLSGGAGLLFEGEAQARALQPGDWVLIPAHCRHRVEWTASGEQTIWLAVFHTVPGDI